MVSFCTNELIYYKYLWPHCRGMNYTGWTDCSVTMLLHSKCSPLPHLTLHVWRFLRGSQCRVIPHILTTLFASVTVILLCCSVSPLPFQAGCCFMPSFPDLFLQLILPVMNTHSTQSAIQLAGTACLYNLTKGRVGEQIHPHVLRDMVHTTLTAMSNFPDHAQVQGAVLLSPQHHVVGWCGVSHHGCK